MAFSHQPESHSGQKVAARRGFIVIQNLCADEFCPEPLFRAEVRGEFTLVPVLYEKASGLCGLRLKPGGGAAV
jgi:hypothetical protein